ncbi:Lrp/AsnC family transcriptional regulator [Rarobacter faecitabidus]|uniref:AsnC family transcriptional regulator n=1 Tax=Rarobacter faecitabidus TaxID=13243 RepID=A0A542ZAK3_RARFA|nr:Lrp/AsnC family transcriptional regulator [Rarobacter faecitabidus]TQL57364.1 AsnC family transcriptional regulator [Rarobacter faecitabidus]
MASRTSEPARPQRSAAEGSVDEIDSAILSALVADGRATLSKLSQETGLSVSAVQSRVQKLERRGVIERYRAVVNHEALGRPISAFVSITPLDYSRQSEIPDKLAEIAGVESCYSIAGAPSYMLLVRTGSPTELEELLNEIHSTVPVSTQTTLILQTYFEE